MAERAVDPAQLAALAIPRALRAVIGQALAPPTRGSPRRSTCGARSTRRSPAVTLQPIAAVPAL